VRNIDTDSSFEPWRTAALTQAYRSSVALPLRVEGCIYGTLNLYAIVADAFGDTEMSLLENLSGEISLGISMQRSRQALLRSEASLLQAQQLAKIGHYHFDPLPMCGPAPPSSTRFSGSMRLTPVPRKAGWP
jgi:two-component system sensor histidine kinase/response regulator